MQTIIEQGKSHVRAKQWARSNWQLRCCGFPATLIVIVYKAN